jgi:hypothetical protein
MSLQTISPFVSAVPARTPVSVGTVELDDYQKQVLADILKRVEDGVRVTTLGGLAGTGKSVIVAALARALPDFAVCAPTNKAAGVLRDRGIGQAQTLSSLIHTPDVAVGTETEVEEIARKLSAGERLTPRELDLCTPSFEGKDELPVSGVICDEASMIGRDDFLTLTSYGVPLIFTGDHGQLQPVKSSDPKFSLMKHLDFQLTKIYRNGGEIARFAMFVRDGGDPARFQPTDDTVQIIHGDFQNLGADQSLAWTNRECLRINQFCRWENGNTDLVSVGDKIIMEETRQGKWISSDRATVLAVVLTDQNPILTVRLDKSGLEFTATFDANFFNRDKPAKQPKKMETVAGSVRYTSASFKRDCEAMGITIDQINVSRYSSDRKSLVHQTYRKLAMIHHPDRGGEAVAFIKIHEAYQRLMMSLDDKDFAQSGVIALNPHYGIPARFAYCMTVHKSQASGFDHVAVYQDMPTNFIDRSSGERQFPFWAYTAASRAISKLTWFIQN